MQLHIFTIDEATQALPGLTTVIEQVRSRRDALIRVLVELEGLRSRQAEQGSDPTLREALHTCKREVDRLRGELAQLNAGVREMGVVVRDYDEGLIDFPAIIDGQPAYLCWRAGEEKVGFWHGPDEGFSGRRPLRKAST